MRFKRTRLDIERTRANWPNADFAPALVLARQQADNKIWHVVDKPVLLAEGKVPSWAIANGDEYIRIPLFEYELPAYADSALALMLQFGLICSQLPDRKVNTAHIVTGYPVELVYNDDATVAHMLCWMGIALTFEG